MFHFLRQKLGDAASCGISSVFKFISLLHVFHPGCREDFHQCKAVPELSPRCFSTHGPRNSNMLRIFVCQRIGVCIRFSTMELHAALAYGATCALYTHTNSRCLINLRASHGNFYCSQRCHSYAALFLLSGALSTM